MRGLTKSVGPWVLIAGVIGLTDIMFYSGGAAETPEPVVQTETPAVVATLTEDKSAILVTPDTDEAALPVVEEEIIEVAEIPHEIETGAILALPMSDGISSGAVSSIPGGQSSDGDQNWMAFAGGGALGVPFLFRSGSSHGGSGDDGNNTPLVTTNENICEYGDGQFGDCEDVCEHVECDNNKPPIDPSQPVPEPGSVLLFAAGAALVSRQILKSKKNT